MSKRLCFFWFSFMIATRLFAQVHELPIPFETDNNYSSSVEEAIAWYQELARQHPEVRIEAFGTTDGMIPLDAVIIGERGAQTPEEARQRGNAVVLINNAIHAGEPCGVDASMLLARTMVTYPQAKKWLQHVTVVIIPYYNADGGMVRSPNYRANQDGPRLQGFRGNALNLDLNRDFMKCDSRNTMSFIKLFRAWDPDLFIDTHTSNGADYAHTMTLIPTLGDKLPPPLNAYQQDILLPALYEAMANAGWPMCPYVHGDQPPEKGLHAFHDLPRYSTGYAALFQSLGFMTEAHMLKPFADRVYATKAFLKAAIEHVATQTTNLLEARNQAKQMARQQDEWHLKWKQDTTRVKAIPFLGYTATSKISEVTGSPRLFYDKQQPWTREIPFLPHYLPTLTIRKPEAYIIPQAWTEVLTRIYLQDLKWYRLTDDQQVTLKAYRILSERTGSRAYEGHYLHHDVEIEKVDQSVFLRKGDIVVPTDQDGIAYLIHALEPQAPDSYFSWNFFDAILQQKEYFSSYVFEDIAAQMLRDDPALRAAFEEAKHTNPTLANQPDAQLDWIYRRSPWYEPTHRIYPVYRWERPLHELLNNE